MFRDRHKVTEMLQQRWSSGASFFVWFGGTFDIIAGLLLIAGFLTQIAAIAGIFIALDALFVKWLYKDLDMMAKYSRPFYILTLMACLSLILSGAGAFAIDLPL
jgi:uncharacterized membrane protein YphA (DoxX/SURF4 family)